MKYLQFILITLFFLTHRGFAQTDSLYELNPVTVTAGYAPVPASQSGRNVQMIQGEMLARLPVNSIDELLRYMPGVEVQQRGPMGTQSDIVIRGGTFQQVLVILDGVRLNDPITGHFNAYIPLAPAEIERVEVLKGAASAIYGTEAVGGVIQIISKSFAAKQETRGEAAMAKGEFGLLKVNGGGLLQLGKTAVSGGVAWQKADGQQQRGTRGFFDNRLVSVSVMHRFNNKWKAGIRSAWDHRDFAAQNFYTAFASDTAKETVKGWLQHAHLGFQKNRLEWRNALSVKQSDDHYTFNSGLAPNINKSLQVQALSVLHLPLSGKWDLVAGTQFIEKKITSNDRGNHRVQDWGNFAIFKWMPAEGFRAETALRVDRHSVAGWQFLPQLSLSYRQKYFQLRASSGRTLRDADFTERYNNYNKTGLRSGSIGNALLTHEQSWSSEAGIDFFRKNWRLSSTVFYRHHKQLIDYVVTPYAEMPRKENLAPGGVFALAKNTGEVKSLGWETDFSWQKIWNQQTRLQSGIGIVWMDTKTPEGEPGFYLSAHARLLVNGHILYQWKQLSLSVTALYKLRKAQKGAEFLLPVTRDYFLVNAKAGWQIRPAIHVFLQTDNLYDTSYADLLGSQMPRRWTMAGLQLTLRGKVNPAP